MLRGTRKCGVLPVAVIALAAACTAAEPAPAPPDPVVTTREFEQRLDEHLARLASQVLQPDAQVSVPASSQTVGCAGGPSWGIVPRSEITVTAGDQAEKLLDDLDFWLSNNGSKDRSIAGRDRQTGDVRELTDTREDGSRVVVRLTRNSPQFTITVTGPCTWPPSRAGGPAPSGLLPPLPAPTGPSSTISPQHFGDVDSRACRSPKLYVFNAKAPAFTGPGPHPMVLANYSRTTKIDAPASAVFMYRDSSLPYDWQPRDHRQAQLLVCVEATTTRDTQRKITCNYSSGSVALPGDEGLPHEFDVFDSVYRVTVREASNGRVVGESSIPGTVGDEDSCPGKMASYRRPLALGLDDKALERYLLQFYEPAR